MKTILRELLLEFQQNPLPELFQRDIALPVIPDAIRKAIVLIGMRRVGKTYVLFQQMQSLLDQGIAKHHILYLNFEDDRLHAFHLEDFQVLLHLYFEMYPDTIDRSDLYFYFDEIQNIPGWERFIRRLLDKEKMKIFITGSSAKLLSTEIATSLRGRCITQEIFPLSFKEYLNYHGVTSYDHLTQKTSSIIKHYMHTYLKQGGFPETLSLTEPLAHQIIQSYVNAAVFRDVIDRHQLSNPHIVRLFLMHCLQQIAAILSVTKIFNTLKSRGETLGRASLYTYLTYFEDAYLLFLIPIFDLSARKRQVNPHKIYSIDQGIIAAYSLKPQMEYAATLETAVFLHLRRQAVEMIYYYKTSSGKEIDFIVQHANTSIDIVQVCYDLSDLKTRQREIDALIEAAQTLGCTQGLIITLDQQETLTQHDITIHILPYWQWVLFT